ncbi:MAG: DUF2807 domain-containing protein [Acidimicrobiales bacterium]|nr:DUF2807 domain-containing protein [Acidimicrobiales bacterium]
MRRALVLLVLLGTAIACDVDHNKEVDGSGEISSEVRSVAGFTRISLQREGTVEVGQGPTESLVVTTDDNLLTLIETEVVDGTLELRTAIDTDIEPSDTVRYEIGVRDLDGLELTGAGTVSIDGWVTDAAAVRMSGAGELRVGSLDATSLDATHSGAGSLLVEGEVQRQMVAFSGVGDYDAADLVSEEAIVQGSGVGAMTLWVTDRLDLTLSGVGDFSYYGSPRIEQTVSGVGTINSLGDR